MRFFSIVLFMVAILPLFAQIKVESKVVEATIYNSGAKITRKGSVSMPSGESEIIISNLTRLDENSIQVGFANDLVKVVDVRLDRDYINVPKEFENKQVWRDSAQLLQEEILWIKDQQEVLKGEEQVIKTNSKLNPTDEFSVSELQNLTDFYRKRILEIRKEISQLKKLELLLTEQKNRYYRQVNSSNRGTSVSVIYLKVIATETVTSDLTFSYFVGSGGWNPVYTIESKGLNDPIQLTYQAKIYQRTGRDWENIPLSLSNVEPQLDNTLPMVETIYASTFPLVDKVQYDTVITFDPEVYEEQVQVVTNGKLWSETLKTQTSTQFRLALPQSIKGDGVPQKTTVKEWSVNADYQYFTAPGKRAMAFLVAQIPDYAQYNLLSGTANLFFENTYLGKSYIDNKITTDTLNLSLGIDYDVVVERNRKTFSAPKFIGNTVKETIDFEIKIRNNKTEPISIKVLDQIPVSTEKAIEIKLIKKDGASFEEGTGKLIWEVTIPADSTKVLDFSYQVKSPKNVRVAGKW